jgi:hypothetical protein
MPTLEHSPSQTQVPVKKLGRPRALNEVKCREVCALISAGCGIERAARYVGCAANTVRREAQRNPEFNERLRRATLAAELGPLDALRQAANKHWRAAAWLLERTDVQRYGKQNVRFVKPEQLEAFSAKLGRVLLDETKDAKSYRRIMRRLRKFIAHSDREVHATEVDPFPKLRRPRKSIHEPAPMSLPEATPLHSDDSYVPPKTT